MKNIIYLTMTHIFFLLQSQMIQAQSYGQNLDQLQWLLGTWQRTDGKPGVEAFETWIKISDHVYEGKGVTRKGNDTVFVENLKILIRDDQAFYVATVSHNAAPVYFKITQASQTGFTSSNPEHDFPKEIKYQLINNKIKATIAGNGKSIEFNFKR